MPDEINAVPEAPGAGGWYTCKVVAAGPADDGRFYIRLTDKGQAFLQRWFYALPGFEREMLAAAFTSLTTGYSAYVMLADTAEWSQINRFYVQP